MKDFGRCRRHTTSTTTTTAHYNDDDWSSSSVSGFARMTNAYLSIYMECFSSGSGSSRAAVTLDSRCCCWCV